MKNIGINDIEPDWKNKRSIVLEPYYMEDVGEGGLGVEVWVNDIKQTRGSVDDPRKQLFKLVMDSETEGIFHVKIIVKQGTIRIGEKDAYGFYPAMYDKLEGRLKIKQFNFVNWMQNPSININDKPLEAGDVFEYLHIVPSGPSFLKVFFNTDKHREEFVRNKTVCDSTIEQVMLKPMYDHFNPNAIHLFNPEENTRRILENFTNMKE